jgi:REP element-mobilizing transposase RayT
MGRSRYRIYDQQAPHFLTCTINNWIPLFTRPATVQVILDALTYRQEQRDLRVYAYVILENHLHLIAQSQTLPAEISSFKSWTAKQLVEVLKVQGKALNAYLSNWRFIKERIKQIVTIRFGRKVLTLSKSKVMR